MDRASISLIVPPPAPLRASVAFLWYWEGTPPRHAKETVIAGAGTGLVINLLDDRIRTYHGEGYTREQCLRGIAASGPSTRTFAIDAFQPKVMGASFRPGAAHTLLGLPLSELRDQHVALEDLWGTHARFLHEQLVSAPDPQARLRLLSRALLARLAPDRRPLAEILIALECFRSASDPASLRIADVARSVGMSHRRFIDVFADHVGLTPKLYLRLRRFEALRAAVWESPSVDSLSWAELAHDHGYSDQSHLIREFREFSGMTPLEYVARPGSGHNHSAVLPDDGA